MASFDKYCTLFLCFALAYAFQPELTMYTGRNYTGNGLIIRSKEANLDNLAPVIIANHSSICLRGNWVAYGEVNFTNWYDGYINWNSSVQCYNSHVTPNTKSLRYLGPSESNTPSVSFYSGFVYSKEEFILEGPAYSYLPFVPLSLITTGWSNWTFFSESNFLGNATCFTSTAEHHAIYELNSSVLLRNIQSARQSCFGREDTYILPTTEMFPTDRFPRARP